MPAVIIIAGIFWRQNMKRIYSSFGMRLLEQAACEKAGCSLKDMMEQAGSAAADFLSEKEQPHGNRIAVLCGKGNNGGDGFVCARLLYASGAQVTVILAEGPPTAQLAQEAFAALPAGVPVIDYRQDAAAAADILLSARWIIDGLFGFGFHGSASGNSAALIGWANESDASVLSLDLPSGLPCDTGVPLGPCIKADYTVTFTSLKPAHVLPYGKSFCGETAVAQVGIPSGFLEEYPLSMQMAEGEDIRAMLPMRKPDGHKGTFGTALCVCGSMGMAGAAVMSASAALRTGTGLVTVAASEELYPVLASSLTEPVFALYGEEFDAVEKALQKASAVLMGCGCGRSKTALSLLRLVLKGADCPCVLDADALNLLAAHPGLLSLHTSSTPLILTPHPMELARLMQTDVSAVNRDRPMAALQAAEKYNACVILKGSGTIIAAPDGRLWFNSTGNDGMAKGGSGDVLAGMLVSLAAQGMPAEQACVTAVYLHGMAGDLCADSLSRRAMLPTDMIAALPKIFAAMEKQEK